jgi:hypothetical protein
VLNTPWHESLPTVLAVQLPDDVLRGLTNHERFDARVAHLRGVFKQFLRHLHHHADALEGES